MSTTKLEKADVANLISLMHVCAIGDIENIIIDEGMCRGMNDARTFVIISDMDIPKINGSLGITRVSAFNKRMNLFSAMDTSVETLTNDRNEISSLTISSGGKSKSVFRCSSSALIKAPRTINDTPAFEINMNADEIKQILNAIRVMGTDTIMVAVRKDGTVTVGLRDEVNDDYSINLDNKARVLDSEDSCVQYFWSAIFAKTFNNKSDSATMIIGNSGTCTTQLHNHTVTLMPKINEED